LAPPLKLSTHLYAAKPESATTLDKHTLVTLVAAGLSCYVWPDLQAFRAKPTRPRFPVLVIPGTAAHPRQNGIIDPSKNMYTGL